MDNLNIKKKFKKNGYFIVKKLFQKKDLIKVKNKLSSFYNNSKFNNVESCLHYNPHEKNILVKKIFSNKNLVQLIKSILDCKTIYGLQTAYFSNPKGTSGVFPHQDDFFMKSGFNNTINVWIPLLNINKNNGPMTFYLKSHKNKINIKNNILCSNGNENQTNLKKFSKKKALCEIGDVVLIHNHIFHKGGKNLSYKKRDIITCSYIKDKINFNVGKKKNRKKFKLLN